MQAIKVILGIISGSTFGVILGLMGLFPFYPVSWFFAGMMVFFALVQIGYFVMIEEADMECALRKKEMYGFCALVIVVAGTLFSRDTDFAAPMVTISLAKNAAISAQSIHRHSFRGI